VIGAVDALKRFNERSATLERKGALLAVGAQHAILKRRIPIANAAKVPDFLP
jgi:hypothetical protein